MSQDIKIDSQKKIQIQPQKISLMVKNLFQTLKGNLSQKNLKNIITKILHLKAIQT